MEKHILFPQINGMVHGGDYNPEQWLDRPDILQEDIRLMKKAGMNSATLGVFSWSSYEPEEGVYHFDWLKKIMDDLYENGIYTILATPSGARPAWLDEKYPEAMRVGADGRRNHHGVRHNHCMSAPIYREKVAGIIGKLVEQVGGHPGLILWHVSNELGGECFCPHCVKRFQKYLAEKFDHDIDKLNREWWTTFWSHTYNSFEQIEPPYDNGEYSIMGLNLEWKRFTTWNMNDYMKWEIETLRKVTPGIPVTTNFMQLYDGLDYRKMAEELDVISWDSYPRFHNDYETLEQTMAGSAFDHAVMRSMKKDKPFMMMESAPGLVNWHSYNKLKRPGIHSLFSLQAIACGSDTVQYFQWRKSRGSYEQYHGAVIDHLGTDDTRIYREVASLGETLKKLPEVTGTLVNAETALIFDWDTMWSIQDMKGLSDSTKQYAETCVSLYGEFVKLGVDMDVISSEMDFSGYKVIVAPMLYMLKEGVAKRMKEFVESGGQLLATYATGYVNENTLCYLSGFPGDGLNDLFGVISEEIDTLYPGDQNTVVFSDGTKALVRDYADILRLKDAEVLGVYKDDFYAGRPAVTVKRFGKGNAYYVGARIEESAMAEIFKKMLEQAEICLPQISEGVEVHTREDRDMKYTFYLNVTDEEKQVEQVKGKNLLTDEKIDGILGLKAYEVAVIQNRRV